MYFYDILSITSHDKIVATNHPSLKNKKLLNQNKCQQTVTL